MDINLYVCIKQVEVYWVRGGFWCWLGPGINLYHKALVLVFPFRFSIPVFLCTDFFILKSRSPAAFPISKWKFIIDIYRKFGSRHNALKCLNGFVHLLGFHALHKAEFGLLLVVLRAESALGGVHSGRGFGFEGCDAAVVCYALEKDLAHAQVQEAPHAVTLRRVIGGARMNQIDELVWGPRNVLFRIRFFPRQLHSVWVNAQRFAELN